MTVTAEHVSALAESWLPAEPDSAFEILTALRGRAPSFVPTWLSALATRGPLPEDLAGELRRVRERTAWLRTVRDAVLAHVPGSYAVKGHAVADRYPAPLVRSMADLDVVVPDLPGAWSLAEYLAAEHGASIHAVVTYPTAGCAVMTLVAFPEATFDPPLAVDVYTFGFPGDAGNVPSRKAYGRVPDAGPAEHLTMIAAEGLEGDFGPKDILDAAVLVTGEDGEDEFALARRYAHELRLVPELAALLDLAAGHGLPVPEFASVPAAEARAARAARTARRLAEGLRHPAVVTLQTLQRGEAYPTRLRTARRLAWRLVDGVLPPRSPVRTHLLRFGVPVRVTGRYPGDLLTSPHGEFLLVNSARITRRVLHPALEPLL
ncbi:hypothetical protein BLA60_02055 [Actinophytocola xinjiangensis]|uniref:Uncharacterized protein n=1 Tax=Actinophytocola xinjiangensis TaxID=485602 RepID=A0A7Z0WRH7_9PSEU|nr:hypothetical protein [Actinophytocola xinjiangensis]OLF13985.1 hypothetical protein BLA60_02055 [Actinophytocola xinjiangensis]